MVIKEYSDVKLAPRLNKQERRIVKLLFEGFTNREMGERLHLSPLTIRNYVSKLLLKYEAHNRTQLLSKVISLRRKNHKSLTP